MNCCKCAISRSSNSRSFTSRRIPRNSRLYELLSASSACSARYSGSREIVRLSVRQRPLISSGLNLIKQNVAAPAEFSRGAEVVETGNGVFAAIQEQHVVTPWNFCNKLLQFFRSRAFRVGSSHLG